MRSFQFSLAISSDNVINQAERRYQIRSAKRLKPWRRRLSRIIIWILITFALTLFGGLLVASFMQLDPTLFGRAFGSLLNLLVVFTITQHFYLMFQTMVLAGNSISREREAGTWELLVLTGINARQIVRGKWWAVIENQLPRYCLLALLRIGATTAFILNMAANFRYSARSLQGYIQLSNDMTILFVGVFGIAFTLANLGLSAACGVLGSVPSQRGTLGVVRGFILQIMLTIVPVVILLYSIRIFYTFGSIQGVPSVYYAIVDAFSTLIDNGLTLLMSASNITHINPGSDHFVLIAPFAVGSVISMLVGVCFFIVITCFVLWVAEKLAVFELATPVN